MTHETMGTHLKTLDTYQDFSDYWSLASTQTVDEQLHLWQTLYMSKYPELLDKQVRSYKDANTDWEEIARKILPTFSSQLRFMQEARNNILACSESVYERASQKLGVDFDTILVIYVGIGCGAGWATTYAGQPAILFGLENIADEKWHTKTKVQGLIAHELGHLTHIEWRDKGVTFVEKERDPLFQIYREGFAQRCEHLIIGTETWHMAPDKEWLLWCEQNKSWLAKEFLKRLHMHAPVNDFFGSWLNIQGKKQTGYFLGHAFICGLEKQYSMREIALLKVEDMRKLAFHYLNSISKE